MVKWVELCTPKDFGVIGILTSRRMNVVLTLRWIWRILRDGGGLWLHLVKAKYLSGCLFVACDHREGCCVCVEYLLYELGYV
jgi:hypothetical protein